ncbi:MAG: T9SS type A sorting domain-containing protein [Deferribacteres bacterium]|nr:T9SS type A sorting domain-containing protein [candidate division KSB1 bacterium]MCB9503840.1 T9SS type A sorting domain-containing protein [Deferribacteres bacterium]
MNFPKLAITSFFFLFSVTFPSFAQQNELKIDNDTLLVKLDLTRGGAISYISLSNSTRSVVNIADEGRYIQQSYYAGRTLDRRSEGQSANWSPWSWNPIQVGDAYRNRAQILTAEKNGDTLYVKCIPMQWDMNNRPAEAEMEQWTILKGNMLEVHNKLTCFRTDTIYGENIVNNQELPAVYPISALKNLYTYLGGNPFENEEMENPTVVNLSSGFWGVYETVNEHWMAFVDDNQWGMGVYNPLCTKFLAGLAGMTGQEAQSSSTSYIAPVKLEILNKNTVYEYIYYVIIGTLEDIRAKVYDLDSKAEKLPQQNEWEFNEEGDTQGWMPNAGTVTVAEGVLHYEITTADPYLTQIENISINAAELNQLSVKMRNNTADVNCDFFFKNTSSPNTFQRIRFQLVPEDSVFREYTLDLTKYNEWNGTIFFLRLDPVADVNSGSVDIDYIRLQNGSSSPVLADDKLSAGYLLSQNYPNPFNPSTTIAFQLAEAGDTNIAIFDLMGRKVADVLYKYMEEGAHRVSFDAHSLSSGVYFYKIQSGRFLQMKKMILLR